MKFQTLFIQFQIHPTDQMRDAWGLDDGVWILCTFVPAGTILFTIHSFCTHARAQIFPGTILVHP